MNYYGEFITAPGLVATGDLSSSQYKIVKFGSTAGTVKIADTAATDAILGVLQNDPADGEAAEVACQGVAKCLAEASVTVGSSVTVSSTGRAKSTDTDGNRIIGIALKASVSAGDVIPVLIGIHDRYKA